MSDNVKSIPFIRDTRGFTLIELLVTVAIVGFIMTAVYAVQLANMRAINQESDLVEIQQDQRISIDLLSRELRIAGYDREETGLPGIVDARSNYLYFTADRDNDADLDNGAAPPIGDVNEHISFCIYNSAAFGGQVLGYTVSNGVSAFGGINDANNVVGVNHTHTGGIAHQALGLVDNIEFLYHFSDGTDPNVDPAAIGKMAEISGVTISMVTRADVQDVKFNAVQAFTPESNNPANFANPLAVSGITWNYPNDGVRRRLITANIRFRNVGL